MLSSFRETERNSTQTSVMQHKRKRPSVPWTLLVCVCVCEREREREREKRQTEREREKERKKERKKDKQTDRQTDKVREKKLSQRNCRISIEWNNSPTNSLAHSCLYSYRKNSRKADLHVQPVIRRLSDPLTHKAKLLSTSHAIWTSDTREEKKHRPNSHAPDWKRQLNYLCAWKKPLERGDLIYQLRKTRYKAKLLSRTTTRQASRSALIFGAGMANAHYQIKPPVSVNFTHLREQHCAAGKKYKNQYPWWRWYRSRFRCTTFLHWKITFDKRRLLASQVRALSSWLLHCHNDTYAASNKAAVINWITPLVYGKQHLSIALVTLLSFYWNADDLGFLEIWKEMMDAIWCDFISLIGNQK